MKNDNKLENDSKPKRTMKWKRHLKDDGKNIYKLLSIRHEEDRKHVKHKVVNLDKMKKKKHTKQNKKDGNIEYLNQFESDIKSKLKSLLK